MADQRSSPAALRPPSTPFESETPRRPRLSTTAARRNFLGLLLLLCVIVLWTASGFLQSSVFADDTYSKPYFVTYINTCFFVLPLVPLYLKHVFYKRVFGRGAESGRRQEGPARSGSLTEHDDITNSSASLLNPQALNDSFTQTTRDSEGLTDLDTPYGTKNEGIQESSLTPRETFHLSLKFCGLWFLANWFNSTSFEYTSVASSTILVSTSSVFTLLFGAVFRVEQFTLPKLVGVCSSLAGIVLISLIDTTKDRDDSSRGSFPYKSPSQIAAGDSLALLSALLYGLYATILTKQVGHDEGRVNMQLFFGFIGLVASVVFLPGFVVLHLVGIEKFELPPTSRIWWVIFINAVISLIADICWAFAVLLTSPLVVTVGLALTIPLSLVGQIFINAQYTGPMYWLGAAVIICSFIWISRESRKAAETDTAPKSPKP
ncbi:MAG: hypothetical protein M1828_000213 [Chrysothrix sp. TS-e1954]|nr:MAG: hypothetical protein M1828_000213 [Chrysothrix sp. TS-e1954]